MTTTSLIHQVLIKIVVDGIPFNLSIKNCFKDGKYDAQTRKNVSLNVGCTLRHYLVFTEILANYFDEDVDESKRLALMIALSDELFVKKLDKEEYYSYIAKVLDEIKTIDEIKAFIKEYVDGKNLIPDEYPIDSNEFLSFRYNTPLWLVKMWKKHYGYYLSKKILKANSKASLTYCRVNYGYKKEDILNKYDYFEDTDLASDVVKFNGFNSLKDTASYKNKEVYPFKTSIKNIFDKVDLDPLKGIAYYSGFVNLFYLELMGRFSNNVQFEFIVSQPQAYFDAKKILNFYEMKNVNLFEEKISSLEACLGKKYHTFFVLPLNSNFSLIRNTPDYFLRFKKETLDELIQNEVYCLEESSKFVEDGGDLVYIIPTISYKESHGVVETFLLNNSEFSLIEEKQYLPCDDFDSSVYFAILRRRLKND